MTALVTLGAAAACNYDFNEFYGLGPPLLDSGSPAAGGAAGAGRSDASDAASGKSGSGGDAGRGGGASGTGGAAGTGATGSGGSSGSAGAIGAGGAAGMGAAGGSSGAAGTAGSSGAGTGGSGASGGTAGSGGSTSDASVDGAGSGGTGGSGTGGAAGTGAAGTGAAGTSGASGTGGTGTGGTATGGAGGVTPPPDAGSVLDVHVDHAGDGVPPFDCAALGGRIFATHCYYAKTTPMTWDVAAQQACPAPAHLVTITSAGEDTFVVTFLTDQSRWIGLHRPVGSPPNTSAFEWVTGETSTYSHWYTANGEPDYDGECVRLGPSNNWGDNPCNAAFPVVCERE